MNKKTLLKKIEALGKEKKTETMTFRFSKREKRKLIRVAKELDTTASTVLRAQVDALKVSKVDVQTSAHKQQPVFLKFTSADYTNEKRIEK